MRRGAGLSMMTTATALWASLAAAQSTDIADYAVLANRRIGADGSTVAAGGLGVNASDGTFTAKGQFLAPASVIAADFVNVSNSSVCFALRANAVKGVRAGCTPPEPFTSPFPGLRRRLQGPRHERKCARAGACRDCGPGGQGRFPRVHVTDAACATLSQMLGRRIELGRCLRLSTFQGNYRFVIDEPIEQDVIFRYEEKVVLVVSETVSRDLWGITVDCADEAGKQRIIFRKAKQGEPLDVAKDDANVVPPEWRASQHEQLLAEIAEIGRQIKSLRGTKSSLREQVSLLEARKQEKWDAIRALWAGDGGWHKLNGTGKGAATAVSSKAE